MAILNRLLSECIRDVDQLTQYLQLNPDDAKRIREISERYPFCVPPYYLGLIDPEDPDEEIRTPIPLDLDLCTLSLWALEA